MPGTKNEWPVQLGPGHNPCQTVSQTSLGAKHKPSTSSVMVSCWLICSAALTLFFTLAWFVFRRFGSGGAVVMVSSWLPLISLNYQAAAFKVLDLESWC